MRNLLLICSLAAPLAGIASGAGEIRLDEVAGNVHVLQWRGGNIGVSAGDDGLILVDDQFAPQAEDILAALRILRDEPVRFVLNTHWHGDHTGGNQAMAERGAVIVAHENVRRRMSSEQFMKAFGRTVPPSPPGALPVVTFGDAVTLHFNDDTVRVQHLTAAHTDGDSYVHFVDANVIHAGDVFFNGLYPFIDVSSGGRIDGVIAACDRMLAVADADTRIIPGHGPVTDREGLQAYRDMLAAIRARVAAGIRDGKSLDAIRADKPTADWDAAWGGGFLKPDKFVEIVHDSLRQSETTKEHQH